MSETLNLDGYPLAWPPGRPKTPVARRRAALFRTGNGDRMTIYLALQRLKRELALLGADIGEAWQKAEAYYTRLEAQP